MSSAIPYTFKGNKHQLNISASTTATEFLEAISVQTHVSVAGLKVVFKGKVLKPNGEGDAQTLLDKYPALISTGAKILVLGTTEQDIAKVHSIDQHANTRKNNRPPPAVKRSQPVRTLDDDKYTFGGIQVLPQFNEQDKARAVLERLKQDKGIIGIMKLHRWQVGSLIELSPAEKSILGYNRNKGELIALRLRTDDLEGFRHYDAVRKVLLHELAHNVWTEHDDNFHALNRQLNKEVQQLDWTAQGGGSVSRDAFFDPANGLTGYHDDLEDNGASAQTWQGGSFVLGGSSSRVANSNMTTRELVARAAQLRQIESEKDEDGMCGAKFPDSVRLPAQNSFLCTPTPSLVPEQEYIDDVLDQHESKDVATTSIGMGTQEASDDRVLLALDAATIIVKTHYCDVNTLQKVLGLFELANKYPKITTNVVEEQPKEISGVTVPIDITQPNPNNDENDYLYLDMNNIIHPCCKPGGKPPPSNEEETMIAIFAYIERIVNMVRPRKMLYMAVDGVAPRVKMNQQRSRRFRTAQEAEEKAASEDAAWKN
ncbi:hypothetical protein BGX26_010564 [Mortierella sp. AD094]|nr:hypothetical protein BGX26_010564 [Mortierella sp. AD094]